MVRRSEFVHVRDAAAKGILYVDMRALPLRQAFVGVLWCLLWCATACERATRQKHAQGVARSEVPVESASARGAGMNGRLTGEGSTAGNSIVIDGGTDAQVVVAMPVEAGPVPVDGTRRGPVTVKIPSGNVTLYPTTESGMEGAGPIVLPAVHVKVAAFEMDITEVTREQYDQCVTTGACSAAGFSDEPTCGSHAPDHPVCCVDHDQAKAFCRWAGKRLPTEAEWQRAAQGNDGRRYPWGNQPPNAKLVNACGKECVSSCEQDGSPCHNASYKGDDGWPTSAPVGSFRAGRSPFGLYDMAGNVAEWTASCWSPYEPETGNCSYWAVRGGSWLDDALDLRVTSRDGSFGAGGLIGIRCVR